MTNNILLVSGAINFWLYGFICVLLIIIGYLSYKLYLKNKNNPEEESYYHFLSDVLDHLPFPIIAKDINNNFRYSYWNRESEIQSGIPKDKAIGYTDIEIYGEERGNYYRGVDEEIVRKGKLYRAEESYETEDGVMHDTLVVKSIVSSAKGHKWLLAARWEITQLKTYERELIKAKDTLEKAIKKQNLALKSIDFGLIYIDKNYQVQWEETTQIKKLTPKRHYIPGQICYLTSALRDKPCPNCAFKEAIETGKIVRHTTRIDDTVDFEVTATPVYGDDGVEIIGGLLRFEDITEKIKISKMLQEAKDKAEESNRLKSAFLANMSHEIRTPLNAIIGFSDMICQTEELEDKEEYMKIVSSNNELLLQLIDDILDLSKIEAGTMDFLPAPTDINELMDGIYRQMEQKNQSPEVRIEFCEQEPECIIETDRRRISQVMINFINNSMKFTANGSISLGYRLNEAKDEIYFYVKDTGIGIPESKQKDVFERFVKLDTFTKGTGLGLSICRVIIEHMGGTIGVDSKEGEGSCFWFKIPAKILSEVDLAVYSEESR